ncbi:MAG: ABC transporter substrate-binding protein [Arenicellales bacterium]|nr:ABC transporter substrate-binding protein [Arenicellales bacterium]
MRGIARASALILGLVWSLVYAGQSPDLLVKETTDKVLQELTVNREMLEADVNRLYQMVDDIVLPHFDFNRMSKLVLGKHWKKATADQRREFEQEFKSLLVRTYATALFEYTGQEIIYKPFHNKQGADRVVVKTEIVPNDGPNIPLYYSLSKAKDGAWLVYDVSIDGISLVTNYRTTYSRIIESKGIDKLIVSLIEKREAFMER